MQKSDDRRHSAQVVQEEPPTGYDPTMDRPVLGRKSSRHSRTRVRRAPRSRPKIADLRDRVSISRRWKSRSTTRCSWRSAPRMRRKPRPTRRPTSFGLRRAFKSKKKSPRTATADEARRDSQRRVEQAERAKVTASLLMTHLSLIERPTSPRHPMRPCPPTGRRPALARSDPSKPSASARFPCLPGDRRQRAVRIVRRRSRSA